MLGRKNYTREEIDDGRAAVEQPLAAYNDLDEALTGASASADVEAAPAAFETRFFNNMTLVLDRYFVHRLRMVTGRDGNLLNEVELIPTR